jgi:hypothetical protein
MVKQGMGKSMGNRECEWIRPRLPLWVDNGAGSGRSAATGEGGDLSARECRHIERHLASCATCRQYRSSLDQALGALAITATQLPFSDEAPSLWPMLERRIAGRNLRAPSRWQTVASRSVDRSGRPWGDLDDERTLRQAWTHDTIREVLAARNRQKPEWGRLSGLVFKSSVAAALLLALVESLVVNRQAQSARSTIAVNSAPLTDLIVAPAVALETPPEISDRDNGDSPVNQVAEIDSPRPAETSGSGLEAAAAAPKSPPHTRFGFDLEHGTPMPADSRDAKPVY